MSVSNFQILKDWVNRKIDNLADELADNFVGDYGTFTDLTATTSTITTDNVTTLNVRKVLLTNKTASSGPGAIPVTSSLHEITTTGVGNALTLANSTDGHQLTIIYVAESGGADTAILTPTTLAGANTTITFNAVGDSADLIYSSNGGWYFLGGTAVQA